MLKQNHKLSKDQINEIRERYKDGESTLAIAAQIQVKPQTIRYHLIRLGIPRRPLKEAKRQHTLNEKAFECINEESAYWIGFLMADGNVHRAGSRSTQISLELSEKDIKHLYMYRDFLGSSHEITRRRGMVALSVLSDKLANDLARFGVTPRKSHTARVIGLEFNRHFWRGVIDGDGTVCSSKDQVQIHLVGSQTLIQQFLDYVKTIVPNTRATIHPFGKIYRVGFGAGVGLQILRELYTDCSVALERKQIHALEMLANANPLSS